MRIKKIRFICCLIAVMTALFMVMPVTVSAANGDEGNWTVSSESDFTEAIKSANEGKETRITLEKEVTIEGTVNVAADAKNITIDLNGFKLTVNGGLNNKGNLTITAKGSDPDTFNGDITNDGGTTTIKAGIFTGMITNSSGKLTITGGDFKGRLEGSATISISGGRYSNKDVLQWLSAGCTLMCQNGHYTVIDAKDAVARQMCGAQYKSGDGIYYRYYDEAPEDAELIGYYVDFYYFDASGQPDYSKRQEVIVEVDGSVNEALDESEEVVNTEKYQEYSEWVKGRAAGVRNPSLEGYSFKGWYEALDYEWTDDDKLEVHQYADTAFDLDTPVTAEMVAEGDDGITLVSMWEKSTVADDSPDTGDDFNMAPPIALMLLAAAVGAGAIVRSRRKHRR